MIDPVDFSRYKESDDVGFQKSREVWLKKFRQYDRNRDELIECWELKRFLQAMGMCPTDTEVESILQNEFNKNDDEVIDFEEFYDWVQRQPDPAEELYQAFRVFDKDGNGYLDKAEFKYVMSSFSNPDEVNEFFEMVDADNDGKIAYKEFVDAFQESDDDEPKKSEQKKSQQNKKGGTQSKKR